jgi:tetratricopeptide (TPR) repeat protein
MGKLFATILIVVLSLAHFFSLGKITEEEKRIPRDENSAYLIPAPILKLTTFEFRGLASDYLFLKSLVFIGSTMERTEKPRVKPWEWKWVYALIDASSDLDPYFYDPYYFANGNFTWDGMMIQETNMLLEKGMRYRDWDPRLPFFIGFNYFYFLQDNTTARKYLLEASQRPAAPQIYADLASRLSYEKKRTENAIGFLEELTRRTDDESLRKRYETRLTFLRAVLHVEEAVKQYKKEYGRKPSRIDDLIKTGLLREVPVDPSGGSLYLDSDGRVRSTSEFQFNFLR